jgi:hypothetical protein
MRTVGILYIVYTLGLFGGGMVSLDSCIGLVETVLVMYMYVKMYVSHTTT